MRIPRVVFAAQTRTVSCLLPNIIARQARDIAAESETLTDPAKSTSAVVAVCQSLTDATRAAMVLDQTCAVLLDMRRALGGEECDDFHPMTRECADLRVRIEAVKKVAPELEVPELDDLIDELDAAIARVKETSKAGQEKISDVCRIASWSIPKLLRQCDDVGMALRAMARAGVLPETVDRNLAFGPAADRQAPPGSPSSNSGYALDAVISRESAAMKERQMGEERAGRQLAARISAVVAEAMEAA